MSNKKNIFTPLRTHMSRLGIDKKKMEKEKEKKKK